MSRSAFIGGVVFVFGISWYPIVGVAFYCFLAGVPEPVYLRDFTLIPTQLLGSPPDPGFYRFLWRIAEILVAVPAVFCTIIYIFIGWTLPFFGVVIALPEED